MSVGGGDGLRSCQPTGFSLINELGEFVSRDSRYEDDGAIKAIIFVSGRGVKGGSNRTYPVLLRLLIALSALAASMAT